MIQFIIESVFCNAYLKFQVHDFRVFKACRFKGFMYIQPERLGQLTDCQLSFLFSCLPTSQKES